MKQNTFLLQFIFYFLLQKKGRLNCDLLRCQKIFRRYYDFKSIWSLQWWPTSLLWLVLCISAVNLLFKTFSGVLPHSILVNSSTEVFRIKISPWKVRRSCRNAFQQQKKYFRKLTDMFRPGARFSKVPETFRARNQIFKSKYKE